MSKHVLGIFKEGMYALRGNRDFLSQLPNEDGILYSASSSHFYAGHKPPSLKRQAFLLTLIEDVASYIATRSVEKMEEPEEKGADSSEMLDCDSKINAAFAFSEFLESSGYYKEVLVEKLSRKKGWKSLRDGRLAKIVCQYLKNEPGFGGCDFNTPLGRSLTVKKWQRSLVAAIEASKAEFEERVKPFPNKWTDFNTIKHLKENPECTSLVIPEGFEEVEPHSFDQCMAGIDEIIIRSPMENVSGYDFLHCPDLRSLTLEGPVSHLDDIGSFNVLEDLVSLKIQQGLQRIVKNSLRNKATFNFLKVDGPIGSIGKGALSGFSACSVVQIGAIDGMSAAAENAIVMPQVAQVEECAFLGSEGVQAVVIGKEVSVKSLAFSKCPNLSVVIIHDDVQAFDTNAFFGCEGLQCVISPDRLIQSMREFYIMEFGYEKAELVQFIPSSEVARYGADIESQLVRLREAGVTIDSPDWNQWNPAPATDTGNPFMDNADEGASVNPFGEDTDEEEAAPEAEDGNPFGPSQLSDISAIANASRRSSGSLSVSSDLGVGNPF